MSGLVLYNSETKKKEKFEPIKPSNVGVYSCGPTVYWNQHIGHMYAYVQWDALVRALKYLGYETRWIMNITDVGHMTSDEDTGEDKMEKGAKREGVTVWELAEKYIEQFKESMKLLGINDPDKLERVTDNIVEQVKLIEKIQKAGYTYKTKMGIVFDTSKFKDYAKFANLDLENLKKREDVKDDPEKKNPSDFFLWITGNKNHVMQWESPWGKGYPGWHIECTAISTKNLGEQFDIHTGGIEHIPVHHTNEVAQANAAFNSNTAKYWLHNAWLTGKDGEKMSKSLGNFLTVQDLIKKGHDPMALRYLILTSHYRKGLKFSIESLSGAQSALNRLKNHVSVMKKGEGRTTLSKEKDIKRLNFQKKFEEALKDDLNTPQAIAVVWEVVKSNVPPNDKYDLLMSFDEVLGLKLNEVSTDKYQMSDEMLKLKEKRDKAREEKDFELADSVKKEIEKIDDVKVKDTPQGTQIEKN